MLVRMLLLFSLFSFIIFAPISNGVIISQVYPNTYVKGDPDEFVAICSSDEPVNVSNWTITDLESSTSLPNISIHPNQTIYLTRNFSSFVNETDKEPNLEYSLRLSNDGDEVLLFDADGELVDAVVYGNSNYSGTGWHGPPVERPREGEILLREEADTDSSLDWSFHRLGQSSFPVKSFVTHGNITTLVTPDDSLEIANFLDDAKSSIYVCTYDFDNYQIMEHILDALDRGVNVRILEEGNQVGGVEEDSLYVAQRISRAGGEFRFVKGEERRYDFIHAKYAIIDNRTVLIGTENWDRLDNRGWIVAITDEDVSRYLLDVFEDDWTDIESSLISQNVTKVPKETYEYHGEFRPEYIGDKSTVTPVIAPDNALSNETVLGLIRGANESVYIEQSYIYRYWNGDENPYLEETIDAARRGCEVKILMNNAWYNREPDDPNDNDDTLRYVNSVAEQEDLDLEAKLVTDEKFDKLHTKGIIVDGCKVCISSINWNKHSPTYNREVGVIIQNPEVAGYYEDVFMHDWGSERNDLVRIGLVIGVISAMGILAYFVRRR